MLAIFYYCWGKKTHGLHLALLTIQILGFVTLTFTNGVNCKSTSINDSSQGYGSGSGGQEGNVPLHGGGEGGSVGVTGGVVGTVGTVGVVGGVVGTVGTVGVVGVVGAVGV